MADLVAGEQPAVVADRYGINRQTVKAWRMRMQPAMQPPPPLAAPQIQPLVEARKQHIGELVLDLLRAKLEASAAIAKAASDPDWLARQSGAELATLGSWLDATAFAIGDRLAGGRPAEPADDAGE
jgi:transposase-like protein